MGRISARSGRKEKKTGVAAPLVSTSCRGNFWYLQAALPNQQKREGPQRPQCAKGQGPWRRGATGCCRLSRQLLVRYGWTVACVGLFVSFVALLDKPVEDITIRYSVWIRESMQPLAV